VGEEVFGFRLKRQLGQGSFARVFQAEQADLAGRPVVLKVSLLAGNEPQTLAQLQHTHIVPIYSAHEDAPRRLRGVCMPYFGGASLSSVLACLWSHHPRPASGRQLREALSSVGGDLAPAPPAATAAAGGAEGRPFAPWEGLRYVRAAAWVVARLAEALQHAHQRGVLHRDVKPSNILLAADGQPMLLDFNVAEREGQTEGPPALGGTVAYMSPEHLRAVASRDAGLARQVDRRADVYSLGLVLFEMLVGNRPFEQTGTYAAELPQLAAMAVERGQSAPSVRRRRPDVPWGLESILRHCLAPAPERRYQQAEHLAEDLRRFLEDRPLKYAPELSRAEQLRKWMRRHPRLTSSGSVATAAALLLLAVVAALFGVRRHLATVRDQLQAARVEERRRAYEDGAVRALCLVNTTTDLPDHLREGLAVCEQTLALSGALDRDDWQDHPDWRWLTPQQREQLAEDTRELLLLLAWARARDSPHNRDVLRGNLALLERAERVEGLPPSRALWQDRALYLTQLGDAAGAENARKMARDIRPASARDHYQLAISYARARRPGRAVAELNRALELNPRHYWSYLQRGLCHLELGNQTLAVADASVCIGLWPELPLGHFNRGYCLEKAGQRAEAIDDYTAALEHDPHLVPAWRNRGMARLELRHYGPALADLDRVVALGGADAAVLAGRGVALEGLRRHPEADAAFEAALARAPKGPNAEALRIRWVYGFAVSERLPERAGKAFDEVLSQQPRHPQALYGRAMLLARQGREREAVSLFDRALEEAPDFVEARRFRAVLSARLGHFDRASQDINACLEREPKAGATLYAAACVAAPAADTARAPADARQAAEQALAFLRQAFERGYGRDKAATDPDLKGARRHPEFGRLLAPARQRAANPR
jgi:serine/threonine protein kinase/Tfp pilus assembly protein PilF